MASKLLWQDWVILGAASWLFLSPFALGFASLSHPAAWCAWVASIGLFVSASEALVVPDVIEEWVDGILGVALMASPWLLGFNPEPVASMNAVAVGTVVTVCAISALIRDLRLHVPGHGGHSGPAPG